MRIVIAEAGEEYRVASERKIRSPQDAGDAGESIKYSETECFVVLCLDAKNGMRAAEIVTTGLLDASLVHPREVFRAAILRNSASIVLLHNHPSGDATPSTEDIRITRQLIEAGKVLDIRVVDHVIIAPGNGAAYSMRESGVVSFG